MAMSNSPDQSRHPESNKLKMGIRVTSNGKVVISGDTPPEEDVVYPVTIGELMEFTATVKGTEILTTNWSVEQAGEGNLVSAYLISEESGVLRHVTEEMRTQNPFEFVFTRPGACRITVQVTVPDGAFDMIVTYSVCAPQVISFVSYTGNVYVGKHDGSTMLRFGLKGDPQSPGILIDAKVAANEITVPGEIGIIQLATNEREVTHINNESQGLTINGVRVLDVGPAGHEWIIYQNVTGPLALYGQAEIQITDAPSIQCMAGLKYVFVGRHNPVVPETYHSYLMFKPKNGVWVPLQVLVWSWRGYTTTVNQPGGKWSQAQDAENSQTPHGAATTIFPTWTANSLDRHWVSAQLREPAAS